MNTSGSRWSAAGRALTAFAALVPVVFFMACGSDRITGLRPTGPSFDEVPTSPATGLVISQVYGGGGNVNAVLRNDYIELYNAGTTSIDLTGWSLQYASTTGTSWSNRTNLSGTVEPGHYFLIQEASGGSAGALLPAADLTANSVTGTINMAAAAGKIALVHGLTTLSGACPKADPSVVDFVGFGSGTNCFEGTTGPTASTSVSTAALRRVNGQQDANDNAADFTVGTPNPRNSSTSTEPPVAVLTAGIAPLTPSLDPGATTTFTASATKGAQFVAVTAAAWTSSDPAVASIDPASGVALALAPGTTTIGVTVTTAQGTATASTLLTVTGTIAPSAIVISQVYGGGGNNGSTLKHDFIELYNGGTTDVSLNGWSVQYSSASGATWSTANKTDLSGVIPAGHYFLIRESQGSGGTVDVTGADVIGSITVGGTSGKIALVRSTAVLTGACPKADAVVADFVGYGTADCFRGSAAAGVLTAATAAVRRDYGRTNTNENDDDFDVLDPAPHNSTQAPPPVGIAATIAVSPSAWSMRIGQTRMFSTTARASDGSLVSTPITWSSSDPAVATIDPARGLLTAKDVGTTTVTATAPNGVVGTATVSVIIGNVTVQGRTDPLPKGFQTQLFLNNGSTDSNNNPVGNADITWSSSNPAVVSVNPTTGVITANSLGSAVLTALSRTDGKSTGTTTIVVSEPEFAPGARIGHNTELGVPTDADASDDRLIVRRQYTTSYNPRRGVTNWVSWNLDASHTAGGARCNCMTADTALVRLGLPAFDTNDWINNGSNGAYSRGHMSPSADWNVANGDNAATFFLTNMLPQNQEMNGGPWGALEDTLRVVAREGKELYIIAGGIFTPGFVPGKAEGYGTISNAGKITIPDSIWKIAIIVPDTRSAGGIVNASDVQVMAVNTPNKKPAAGETWHDYVTTIDKIQKSTGYDFLSALPESIQCHIESRNCAPVAHITGGGIAGGSEGQTLHFDASTSTDDGAASALRYEWSVDGAVVGAGAALDYTFANNGTFQVRLAVTDGAGASNAATASVVITNVAPAVAAFDGATLLRGESYAAAGAFADPGADSWSATVSYGDGSPVTPLALSGKSFALGHRYATAGTFTVTVTVTDSDGATGTRTATVTVLSTGDGIASLASTLAGLASTGAVQDGDAKWLANKLDLAAKELERGNTIPTRNQLEELVGRIDAARAAGRLTSETAAQLTAYANRLLASLT